MDTRAKYFSTDGKTTHEQKKLIREQILEIAKQLHKKGIPGEAQKNRFSLFGCWVFHISGALDLCCDCGIKRIATDLTPHEMAMFINILKPKDIK